MEDNLKQLNSDYKQKKKEATSKEEKQHIKHDYKEMKGLIKDSNKLLKDAEKDQKKWDKVWDNLDKEYQKLGEVPTFEEVKVELNDNQQQFEEQKKHSDEVIRQANETINKIDEKLAELEKKESLEKTKQDYNNWKNEVLNRINSEEYQNIEDAKIKAKNIIKSDNDLTSIWEKDEKYYVVLSKDREQAFRNNYKEIIKYDVLIEEMKYDNSTNIELDENNTDDRNVKITIKEYIPSITNDDIKLSFELYSKHFLPSIKPHTIFYKNKQINDDVKYENIINLIENNINIIKKLNLESINSYKGGLQEIITIQLDNENYILIGNTNNQEMKQLYGKIKSKILEIIEQKDVD